MISTGIIIIRMEIMHNMEILIIRITSFVWINRLEWRKPKLYIFGSIYFYKAYKNLLNKLQHKWFIGSAARIHFWNDSNYVYRGEFWTRFYIGL